MKEVRSQMSDVRCQRSEVRGLSSVICHLFLAAYFLSSVCFAEDSGEYVKNAWSLKADPKALYAVCDECITKFSSEADALAAGLKDFPATTEEKYTVMNKVAVCYFIKGETLYEEGKKEEALKVLKEVIAKYPYAQEFDASRGVYWKVKEVAQETVNKIVGWERIDEEWSKVEPQINPVLYDPGTEFPVNYAKYGKFSGLGTKEYNYSITQPIELSKAVGEGIYPNTTSIKFDPEFIRLKKDLDKINQWQALNSRDLRIAFYKWNIAPEPLGMRQFFIADILERSGLLEQAIKAYYAVVVHFPKEYGWTYWHTPWYIGKTSLYRIKYLTKEHPELKLKLEGASIEIINGFDNDVRNDVFIVNPGRLIKTSIWDKLSAKAGFCAAKPRKFGKIVKTLGGDKVKLVRYESGDWQMLVNNKLFMMKGITYAPTRVGESPDKRTIQNWTTQDINNNGLIDAPCEAWVDKNKNNLRDKDETTAGDFTLMKEMGVNCIRLYHQPFKLNKELIRQMYQKYGIYILLGDFLGKYALGSKVSWNPGTDYDDPAHKENMLNSVKEMVLEFKDEPYVLVWILGNENVYGVSCNADKKPESFFKFANEAACLIKSLDPQKRPVAIASGDTLFLDVFAKNCPDIDIFGANCYRGRYGFLDFWEEVKRLTDKPAMITEYGAPSIGKGYTYEEGEEFQALYHKGCWLDIFCNSAGYQAGNAIGGIIFEWLDEWWKAYEPYYHDKKGLFSGPFLDGYMHEEWLGIVSQGNGKNSPFQRQLKKIYFTYKRLWADNH
jgi:beta-glucuronidase